MKSEAIEEAVQSVCAARGEVGAEAVAADVLHLVLVGERRHGTLRIFAREVLLQEDKVGEAAAHFGVVVDEGLEVGVGDDEVGDVGVLGAFFLLLCIRHAALQLAVQAGTGEVDVGTLGFCVVFHLSRSGG